ncbi:MAG: hypothetical protein ACPGJE_07990, partial [Wenzhouxiangellaceae bacterium]
DREIRIIHRPNYRGEIPRGVPMSVDIETLIEEVVVHPAVEEKQFEELNKLLQNSGLSGIRVRTSRCKRQLED